MPNRLTADKIERIISMTEQRYTQAEIAKEVGCSVSAVRTYQRKENLPASNKHGDGRRGISAIPPTFEAGEASDDKTYNLGSGEWIILADKTIKLAGVMTGYKYIVGAHDKSIKIDTGYNDSVLEVDLKDLVAFGNELLDVADMIATLKKNVWEI